MPPFIKQVLHWAGSGLALVGVVFVMLRLNDYSSQLDFSSFDAFVWIIIVALVLLYGLANIMLALAWRNLLEYFGANTSRLLAVRIYGLTQLAKYVPGNIFHLAGRQAMGLTEGIPGWPLAKASIWELVLISTTGAVFGVLVLPHFIESISVPLAAVVFLGVLVIVALALQKYVGPQAMRAVGWYVFFLTISGMVFVILLALLMRDSFIAPLHILPFCGAFVLAWLAGLLTPGAPAGVGVRELALMFMLYSFVPKADLLLAVLLGRLVTVGGDVLFFLVASFFSVKR